MKIKITALASVLALTGSAYAAPCVTLFGAVDTGLLYKHSKTIGEKSVNALSIESGINETSVWGISGKEQIGETTIGFRLESEFSSDDGRLADDALFGREAALSVSGGYGSLGAGRMGSLGSATGTYDTILSVGDAFDGGDVEVFGLAVGSVMNNAITYQTPAFAGFTLTAQYSFKTDEEGVENKSSANRYTGASLNYELGNFQAVAGYEQIDRANNADVSDTQRIYTLGTNFTVEDTAQFFAMVQRFEGADEAAGVTLEDMDETVSRGLSGWGAHLGTIIPAAGGDLTAGLYWADGKVKDSADGKKAKYLGAAARYVYPLSKRSSFYAGVSYGESRITASAASDVKTKTAAVYSGLSHTF